jgi:cytochrome c peroxidase
MPHHAENYPLTRRFIPRGWVFIVSLVTLFVALTDSGHAITANPLKLRFSLHFGDRPVVATTPIPRAELTPLAITRFDLLLSRLALQKANGDWLESQDWFARLRLAESEWQAHSDGVPTEEFIAIRFDVGLPADIDAADPAQWPSGHALHPLESGMHWDWQGSYIFAALEGRSGDRGWSYHLGGAETRRTVTLPVRFKGGSPLTLDIRIDAAAWLADLDFDDRNSTHSREGDELALLLASRTPGAFGVTGIHRDTFHPPLATTSESLPPGTTAYELRITDRFPRPALPSDNPLTQEGVALGRALFHDVRLSKVRTQSCASCHQPEHGFADSLPLAIGAEGQVGRRNSMPVTNLAWSREFFWDGRAKSLREQVLQPITDKHEMNAPLQTVIERLTGDDGMQTAFTKAFGSPGISSERIAKALEQHLLTLISQDSKFDRALRKLETLSASEARGLQLFVTEFDPKRGLRGADCFHCHGGMLFSDFQHHNNGLRLTAMDLGRMEVTGQAADRGKFKTPSLRNVALTAPYMHDGRFGTLEEVVEHYSTGVIRSAELDPNMAKHPAEGIQLSSQDKQDLVAFLKTLTDRSLSRPEDSLTQNIRHNAP